MSLESPEIAIDFLKKKEFFEKLGYEIVGKREINNEDIYFVRERKNKKNSI